MRRLMIGVVVVVALAMIGGSASAGEYLVYRSGGGQYVLEGALDALGFTYDVKSASDPVTAADLTSHKALIVGWSAYGYDMSGLDPAVLTAGITGNKILTGHDADYHTYYGTAAAATFMERAVLFAGGASTAGILAFPVYDASPFSYLPSAWGISSFDSLSEETISAITTEGNASGLYSGLSLASLSNWRNSYHAGFTAWDSSFNAFETGSYGGGTTVTIGTTVTPIPPVPEPATLPILVSGLVGLAAFRKKLRK